MAELALALVGTVDVALRSSLEIYRFFSDLKDAPSEIEDLRSCIDDNRQLLLATKEYLQRLKGRLQSSSMLNIAIESQPPLRAADSAIKALQRTLDFLSTLTKTYPRPQRTWSRIKWKFDAKQVVKYRERMEASKSSLTSALVLVSRLDSACATDSLRTAMKTDLGRLKSKTDAALKRQSNAIHAQVQSIATVSASVTNANHVSQREHKKTRDELSQGQSKILDRLVQIDLKGTPQLKPAVKSGKKILFVGESPEALLNPLLLLREHLRSAILKAVSRDRQPSPDPLYRILSEVEHLQASVLQEAAAFIPGSSATPFDDWTYTGSSVGAKGALVPKIALQWPHSHTIGDGACQRSSSRSLVARKTLFLQTPVGELKVFHSAPDPDSDACGSEETGFLFVPSPAISSSAVGAWFLKMPGDAPEPRFYTQLNAFCVVPEEYVDRQYGRLFSRGTIEQIDTALRRGGISPYHVDNDGDPQCMLEALIFCRYDVLQYFDEQGIGISNLKCENLASYVFWDTVVLENGSKGLETISRMHNYMQKKLNVAERPTSSSPRVTNVTWAHKSDLKKAKYDALRNRILHLQATGYNFEQELVYGRTPFIASVGMSSCSSDGSLWLAALEILLELGVDVNARGDFGGNAYHSVLWSLKSAWDKAYMYTSVFEDVVMLLVSVGVHLHHTDDFDVTPSQSAHQKGLWKEWCRALKRSGVRIQDVMEVEGDLPWERGWDDDELGRYRTRRRRQPR